MNRLMFVPSNYQRLPKDMLTGKHENDKLERLWIGEWSGYSKTSTYVEDLQSPNCLLSGD